MRERKYTLPRHTNLAKQGARTGAFFIDLAIGVALTLAFYFGCFNLIFKSKVTTCQNIVDKEKEASGLFIKKDGDYDILDRPEDHKKFEEKLVYFYLEYFPGKTLAGESKKQEKHDMRWFNKNILEINENNKDSIYTYNEGNKDVIGVPNKNVVEDELRDFIFEKYANTIMYKFYKIDFVQAANVEEMGYHSISFTASSFIGLSLVYILLPWILKNGQSVGKKVFKLGLASSDGYKMKNRQLFMRFLPLGVCSLTLFLFYLVNLYIVLSIYLIIFLVSFALTMASPKKMSLHDFTAQTIVVDLASSTIFESEIDEEAYILKEENDEVSDVFKDDEEGEEPELKYEK